MGEIVKKLERLDMTQLSEEEREFVEAYRKRYYMLNEIKKRKK